jgi:2-hydroxy-3-keto-5-methylthiopentenyl-1-phosphate phosphatase
MSTAPSTPAPTETLNVHLLVDFDGTIAMIDTVDALLSLHAEDAWLEIETAWIAGKIGSRDAMAAQVALLKLDATALDTFIDSVVLDPGFASFVTLCRANQIPVTVVSDGIDHVVTRVLGRHNVPFTVRANHLVQTAGERWALSFPFSADGCSSGNCKCQAPTAPGALRVLIGDGRSDFCAAGTVDLCLAKGKLVEHCRHEGIAYVAFRDFNDVTRIISDLISGRVSPTALVQAKEATHAR